LANLLNPGDVFYDVGANVGFFTVIGAKIVGPTGQVYAFEPVPDNYSFLGKNIEINNFRNVSTHKYAISKSGGKGELFLSEYSGGSTLSEASMPPDFKGTLPVELATIDDLVVEKGFLPPSLVKIDVEGAEMDVIQGMVQTIEQYKPIIIYEIDDGDENAYIQKQQECDRFIQNFGYEVIRLENSYPIDSWMVSNTVAIPIVEVD
jgi:FkbM family methyltransferase